jgi:hypothetical protein
MEKILKTLNKIIRNLPVPKDLKLTWQLYLIDHLYQIEIAKLKRSKPRDHDQLRGLEHLHSDETSMIYEERDMLQTRKLTRQARRLCVTVPRMYDDAGSPTDLWEQSSNLGYWYFTDKGFTEIRKAIRDELKWYYQRREHYTNWATGLIGIIGMSAGLLIGWWLK